MKSDTNFITPFSQFIFDCSNDGLFFDIAHLNDSLATMMFTTTSNHGKNKMLLAKKVHHRRVL